LLDVIGFREGSPRFTERELRVGNRSGKPTHSASRSEFLGVIVQVAFARLLASASVKTGLAHLEDGVSAHCGLQSLAAALAPGSCPDSSPATAATMAFFFCGSNRRLRRTTPGPRGFASGLWKLRRLLPHFERDNSSLVVRGDESRFLLGVDVELVVFAFRELLDELEKSLSWFCSI